MKSIISRMGEMKQGLSVDEDGEFIDASNVETALKSVGVALRDSQGQFRNLDDVLIELASKWDTLDSVTRRYLGTTIAGNRQQSRFLALMENYDRLVEVQAAAMNSEDAGLIQYAKTLDSLETKLNNIKTNFQQFYMEIINGPLVGGVIDFINILLKGLNNIGSWNGFVNLISIITGVKSGLKLLTTIFSNSTNQIISDWNNLQNQWLVWAKQRGYERGRAEAQAYKDGLNNQSSALTQENSNQNKLAPSSQLSTASKWSTVLSVGGAAISTAGVALSNASERWGASTSHLGSMASGAGMGLKLGAAVGHPIIGAIVGAIVPALTGLGDVIEAWDPVSIAEEKLEKAQEEAEEAKLQRAEARSEASNLETTISNLKKLQAARYQSEEAEQEYIDACNAAAETYPQLVTDIDESGNQLIDIVEKATEAEELLATARLKAAEASEEAATAELQTAYAEYELSKAQAESDVENASTLFGRNTFEVRNDRTLLQAFSKIKGSGLFNDSINELITNYFNAIESGNETQISEALKELSNSTDWDIFISEIQEQYDDLDIIRKGSGVYGGFYKDLMKLDELANSYVKSSNEEKSAEKVALAYENQKIQKSAEAFITNEQLLNDKSWATEITSVVPFFNEILTARMRQLEDEGTKIFTSKGEYTAKAKAEIQKTENEWREKLTSLYESLGYNVDDFNSLLTSASKGNLSLKSFEKQYSELGIDTSEGSAGAEYWSQYQEYILKAQQNLLADLLSREDDFGDEGIFSLSEGGLKSDDFSELLNFIPPTLYSSISEYVESIQKQITSGSISSSTGSSLTTGLFNVLSNLSSESLNLTEEQLYSVQQAIVTAAADGTLLSLSGQIALIEKLSEEIGLSDEQIQALNIFENFEGATYNLITEWGSLTQTLSSSIDDATDVLKKATSGLNAEELNSYIKKYGLAINDFEFVDGQYYLTNVSALNKALNDEIEKTTAAYEEEAEAVWNTGVWSYEGEALKSLAEANSWEEAQSLDTEGLTEEQWHAAQTYYQNYADWAADNGYTDLNSQEVWDAYVASLGEAITDVQKKALEYAKEEAEYNARKAESLLKLNDGKSYTQLKEEEALQTIAEKGLTGYTKEEISELQGALGNKVSYELQDNGTYTLGSSIKEEMSDAQQELFESTLSQAYNKATSALEDIAGKIADGEINALAGYENLGFSQDDLRKALFEKDVKALRGYVQTFYASIYGEILVGEDLDNATSKFINFYTDETNSNILHYFELAEKQIKGTLSNAETDELNKITANLDSKYQDFLSSLGEEIVNNVLELANAAFEAVQNGEVSYEDVESYVNAGLSIREYQEKHRGWTLKNNESYEDLDDIFEDNGRYSDLSKWLKLAAQEGVNLNPENIFDYFAWDETIGNFVIKNIDGLKELFDDSATIQDVIDKSVKANDIEKEIDLSDLKKSIPNSISSILTDITNASLSDLTSLYEEINGEDSLVDADEGLLNKYQEALKQAQYGSFELLIDILKELAEQGGADESEVKAIITDAQQTYLSNFFTSLSGGLGGTLTNADFASLAKQLNVKTDDYSKYVYSTQEGLKYTTEGALLAIDGYLDAYGRTAEAARAVAESLTSSDSALGTYEGITAAIEKIEAKGEEIGENEQKTLTNLKAIKAQLTQISSIRMFDFMNFDYFDGQADNFTTLTNNLESAVSTLQSAFEDEGKIKATDFLNIFHWIEDYGGGEALKNVVGDLDAFKLAMLNTMDIAGNLDFSKLQGFSIGMEDLAGGLDESFQKIAEEQAGFWTDYAKFLEKLAKLEEGLNGEQLRLIPEIAADESNIDDVKTKLDEWYKRLQEILGDEDAYKLVVQLGFAFDTDGSIAANDANVQLYNSFANGFNSGDPNQITYAGLEKLKNLWTSAQEGADNTATSVDVAAESQDKYTESISKSEDAARNLKQTLEEVEEVSSHVGNTLYQVRFTSNIQTIINALKSIPKSITVDVAVNEKTNTLTVSGGGGITSPVNSSNRLNSTKATTAIARGTANNIKGNALLNGTKFLNKTLVGELGPELAVYDDQYHLLGEHGAEFVNLPDDAIVFNHKQTKGIIQGQAGYRGKALVEGNAYASGSFASAAAQAREIAAMWQAIAGQSVSDLLNSGSGGGGGSGNTIKAVTEELEEWYNLSRQIADIEQEINNIVAERKNILEKDGEAYLRSLRAQERLLNDQAATQQLLLGYQELQLKRQKDQINTNVIWSQFLTVGEDGLLQYKKGNELNGGKGALQVLQELNEMSGADQVAFLNKLGYSYTDNDGNKLEGEELIQKFFDELQDQIDQYDSLYDTVHSTEQTLEELETSINEINDEIKQNQLDLEQAVYDIVVEAWEAQIDAMEEQKELIEEANEAYISGLNNALSKEKELYSQNQSIANRESLQRQLSLLRRSGGSASQIASLEEQLDSALKDEYFNKQQQMIENIQDANEEQVKKLEEQIRLQEEALEYQKENGVIWTKVYEILGQGTESILDFMAGNSTDFFAKSALQQEEMLIDWAHKVGIYTEDKIFENHRSYASKNIWGNGQIWDYQGMAALQGTYNSLSADQQKTIADQFANEYATARMNGDDNETAAEKARQKVYGTLSGYKEQAEAKANNSAPTTGNSSGTSSTTSTKSEGKTYYKYTHPEKGERTYFSSRAAAEKEIDNWLSEKTSKAKTIYSDPEDIDKLNDYLFYLNRKAQTAKSTITSYKKYSSGGLVDYTGIAAVHGSPSKPEGFLNAEQTAQIREALEITGKGNALSGIKAALSALNATVKNAVGNYDNSINNLTIAPGAVVIQVDELADSYDVEELSKDVMNRMVSIASKSTSRGVNRR